jgi:hypothetical protein
VAHGLRHYAGSKANFFCFAAAAFYPMGGGWRAGRMLKGGAAAACAPCEGSAARCEF